MLEIAARARLHHQRPALADLDEEARAIAEEEGGGDRAVELR